MFPLCRCPLFKRKFCRKTYKISVLKQIKCVFKFLQENSFARKDLIQDQDYFSQKFPKDQQLRIKIKYHQQKKKQACAIFSNQKKFFNFVEESSKISK